MIAFFVPSPLANRSGEVTRKLPRYKPEHFKDILQEFTQKNGHIVYERLHMKLIRMNVLNTTYAGVLICSQ